MMWSLVLFVILCFSTCHSYITYIEVKYPLKGQRSPPGSVWPLPQKWTKSDEVLTLNPNYFRFIASDESLKCDIIENALGRYRGLIFNDKDGKYSPQHSELNEISMEINDLACGYPMMGDDEHYNLIISSNNTGKLKSQTVWGALRGLETFSQLVYQQSKTNYYLINATEIDDFPRFKYRGLLLDTARHFQPMKILLDNLDAMSYNKLNVFHWHIVDDQSFPFESKVFPNLTSTGAYTQRHIYKQRDVKTVIEEARLRGIRVIPEIDTPGHTQAFGKAFPELLTPCYGEPDKPYTAIDGKFAAAEILDPTKNNTFDFFKRFFSEIRSIFVDEYIHLGMDEVYYDCWKSNPDVAKFMEENDMKNISELEQYYVRRTIENVRDIGYKYMTWQDPVDNGVEMANDTVVQIWKDTELVSSFKPWQEYIEPIANNSYQMILSACWYLNYISYGQDWKKYYMCDPHNFTGLDEHKELVIGGEACMWSEYADGTNILPRLWPRASAVAERLWSNPTDTQSTDDAQFRLDEQRCRMLRRRIPTQPILNGFCGEFEVDEHPSSIGVAMSSVVIVTVFALICSIFVNSW